MPKFTADKYQQAWEEGQRQARIEDEFAKDLFREALPIVTALADQAAHMRDAMAEALHGRDWVRDPGGDAADARHAFRPRLDRWAQSIARLRGILDEIDDT